MDKTTITSNIMVK